jgi:ribosomal protein S18 acetylase RimI-like enzyme
VLDTSAFEAETSACALLTARGYVPVRAWVHLIAELEAPPPAPVWPAGITVRRMDQSRDWPAVGAELDAAFADHWGQLRPGVMPVEADAAPEAEEEEDEEEDDPYWNSRDFCFVALDGDQVIASCLGNARAIEWPERGRVGSLSVLRPYRRRGIARALMLHAFGEFYRHGTPTIVTDTDAAGFTGAYRLYQDLGMRIYRTTHTFEKELRSGRELRLLAAEELGV